MVFVTKKCTQSKALHTLKTDAFDLSDNKIVGKLDSKSKLFLVLIHLKHPQNYNHPCSFPASLVISVKFHPRVLKFLFNAITIIIFIGYPIFSYLIPPYATIIWHTIRIKYIISLYKSINALLVKHAAYQKAEFFHSEFFLLFHFD